MCYVVVCLFVCLCVRVCVCYQSPHRKLPLKFTQILMCFLFLFCFCFVFVFCFFFCFFLFALTISILKLFFNAYPNIVLLDVCYKYPYQTFSLKLIQILCCVCVLQTSITKPFFKVDLIIACLVCVLPSPYSSSFCKVNQSK